MLFLRGFVVCEKNKRDWYAKMMRAIERGIDNLEELERVEEQERAEEAQKQQGAGSSGENVPAASPGWPEDLGPPDDIDLEAILAGASGVFAGENSSAAAERS